MAISRARSLCGIRLVALMIGILPLARSASERLANDTPRTTPSGVTFTAPKDWSITSSGNMVLLEAPEADSRLAIVDVEAGDAAAAVESTWKTYRPESKRPLKLSTPNPPRNGWEEDKSFNYETSPNERVVVFANARRAAGRWT